MTAITYVGRKSGFVANVGKRTYEFEWQKSKGIGRRIEEVDPKHALILSKWRDGKKRKIFILE